MASSWISNKDSEQEKIWPPYVEQLRYRGHRGGDIPLHRSMIRLVVNKADVAQSVVLTVGFTWIWIYALPSVCELWYRMFSYWLPKMGIECTVSMVPQQWSPVVRFSLPFVGIEAGTITHTIWLVSALATVAIFAGTYFLGEEQTPWLYILRALVLIQTSALVYFAVGAARFPHDVPTYTMGMLSFAVILIGLVPCVLAITYYMFNFSLWKKLALTALIMGYLAVFMPLQFLLQSYVLHWSILLMPLLYFAFGPFLDVLMFVCFYSWGMSWKSRISKLT